MPNPWHLGESRWGEGDWEAAVVPPNQFLGPFGNADLGIMKPHLKVQLMTPLAIAPTGATIPVPVAPLDWCAVPQVTLGWRLCGGAGDIRLSYRLLASSGQASLPVPEGGNGSVRSRLNVNTIDLDYVMPEFLSEGAETAWWFLRDLRFGIGARGVTSFADSHVVGLQTEQQIATFFAGGGLRFLTEWHKQLCYPGLNFYSRLAATFVVAPLRQSFNQITSINGVPQPDFFNVGLEHTGIGIGAIEAGFSWTPPHLERRLRLTTAYSWERWWDFGQSNDATSELTLQGLILRAEWNY